MSEVESLAVRLHCSWCDAAPATPCAEWDRPVEHLHESRLHAAASPIASDWLRDVKAAAETRGRAEALLPIRRYAEAVAITYRARGIDDRAPLDLLILLDRADSLAAPRGDAEGK